jgi:hypothetical protein
MSLCLSYQQISIIGRCRKNGIVSCILLHEYGLKKRITKEKPCDYFTQDVLACDNVQKLTPCHVGAYCTHLEKQAPTLHQHFIFLVVLLVYEKLPFTSTSYEFILI